MGKPTIMSFASRLDHLVESLKLLSRRWSTHGGIDHGVVAQACLDPTSMRRLFSLLSLLIDCSLACAAAAWSGCVVREQEGSLQGKLLFKDGSGGSQNGVVDGKRKARDISSCRIIQVPAQ